MMFPRALARSSCQLDAHEELISLALEATRRQLDLAFDSTLKRPRAPSVAGIVRTGVVGPVNVPEAIISDYHVAT